MVKLWSSKPSLWVRFPFPLFVPIMVFLKFFFNFFSSIFYQNRNILGVFFTIINWFLNIMYLNKNIILTNNNLVKFSVEKSLFLYNLCFYLLDTFYINYNQCNYNKFSKLFSFKLISLNNNKFYTFNNTVINNYQIFLYGLRSVWKHLRLWILPITILFLFIYYSFFIRSLPFSKVFFGYLLLANMFYLFISGFVFFF